jgi:hypothetical protein
VSRKFSPAEKNVILKQLYAVEPVRRSMILQLATALTTDAKDDERDTEVLAVLHYYTVTPRAVRKDWAELVGGDAGDAPEGVLPKK